MTINEAPLDRKRPYGTVHGDPLQRQFEQDGRFFNADGTPWTQPRDAAISGGSSAAFAEWTEPQQADLGLAAPFAVQQPAPTQVRETSKKDWTTIEAQYHHGRLSVRQIAAQAGLTEGAIRKRARTRGWTRDVAPRG